MISIEKGSQHGYKSDGPVLKLTHSFTRGQLLQLAAMAVDACGMDEVLQAIGATRENNRPKGYYQLFIRGEQMSNICYFTEEEAVGQAKKLAEQKRACVQVMHNIADATIGIKKDVVVSIHLYR